MLHEHDVTLHAALQQQSQQSDTQRRLYAQACLNYYRNNCRHLLEAMIDMMVTRPEDRDELKKYIEHENLVQSIVEKISLKFSEEVAITLKPNTQLSNQKELDEHLQRLLKQTDFRLVMHEVEKLTNVVFDIAVVPQPTTDGFRLDIITPDLAFIEQQPQDPLTPNRFYYLVGQDDNDNSGIYHVWQQTPGGRWAKHQCYYNPVEGATEPTPVDQYEYGTSLTYPELPVVMFRNWLPLNTFWYPGKNHLVERNITVDLRLTDLHKALAYNVPQLFTRGFPEDKPLIKSRSSHINLPLNELSDAQPEARYLHPNEKLAEMHEVIMQIMASTARAAGISDSFVSGAGFSSGYHMALSMWQNIRNNRLQRLYWRQPLKKLLRLMCITANQMQLGPQFPIDVLDFNIDFGEIDFPESRAERAEADGQEKANGTLSTARIIARNNPDINLEQAAEQAQKIAEEEKSLLSQFQ